MDIIALSFTVGGCIKEYVGCTINAGSNGKVHDRACS